MDVLQVAWLWLAVTCLNKITFARYSNSALKRSTVTAKKSRPIYHVTSQFDYLNEVAAFTKFHNKYHVFFQSVPISNTGGVVRRTNWGHVISENLIDWHYYPHSLVPREIYEQHGCLAGSAVEHNGYLTIFYTGTYSIGNLTKQNQNIAISTDGIIFQKYLYNPVINSAPNNSLGEFRNPKVWSYNDTWYMMIGSMSRRQHGQLLLYVSPDMFHWKYSGVLAHSFGDMGYMWESPDFFELDGNHVLFLCAQGVQTDRFRFRNFYQSGYFFGTFDYSKNRFTDELEVSAATYNTLDHGHDFYAPKTMLDTDERRLLIAWLGMWDTTDFIENGINMLTIVRELRISITGELLTLPARELTYLRAETLEDAWYMPGEAFYAGTRAFELLVNSSMVEKLVQLTFEWGTKKFVVEYNALQSYIMINRGGIDGVRRADWSPDHLHWRIFVDYCSVEIFCGAGELVFSSRVNFRRGIRIQVGGDTTVHIKQYRLRRSIFFHEIRKSQTTTESHDGSSDHTTKSESKTLD